MKALGVRHLTYKLDARNRETWEEMKEATKLGLALVARSAGSPRGSDCSSSRWFRAPSLLPSPSVLLLITDS